MTATAYGAFLTPMPQPLTAGQKGDAAAQEKRLDQACRLFESHFLKEMMKAMRKTVDKSEFLSGGMGEEMFTDMLDQAICDASAQAKSMGLADMLKQQLSRDAGARPGANITAQQASLAMPVQGQISSAFGLRTHPITGQERPHDGVDLAAPQGQPVVSALAGTVSFAGWQEDYGNMVVVDHPDGRQTRYAHLESIAVEAGQTVGRGQTLGQVGSTGLSTGPHLHFELRDAQGRATDPLPMLASGGVNITT